MEGAGGPGLGEGAGAGASSGSSGIFANLISNTSCSLRAMATTSWSGGLYL